MSWSCSYCWNMTITTCAASARNSCGTRLSSRALKIHPHLTFDFMVISGVCRRYDMELREEREIALERLKKLFLAGHVAVSDFWSVSAPKRQAASFLCDFDWS